MRGENSLIVSARSNIASVEPGHAAGCEPLGRRHLVCVVIAHQRHAQRHCSNMRVGSLAHLPCAASSLHRCTSTSWQSLDWHR